jgi:AcrR family transcriptional regulator
MSPRIGLDTATVVKTAALMADEQGLDQISLASLARRLNIRTPSLYNHIEGLEGLKRQLGLYGLEELLSELQQKSTGLDKEKTIRSMAKAYVDFARLRPGLYELTLQAPDQNDTEYQKAGKAIVELLLNVFKEYKLTDEGALHAVRCFRSGLHGFASLEQKGGFGLPLDLDVTFQLLIDSFICGIPIIHQNSFSS